MGEIIKQGETAPAAVPAEKTEATEVVLTKPVEELTEEELKDPKVVAAAQEEVRKQIREGLEKNRKIAQEAAEAIGQGKGRMRLEVPIALHDREYTELAFDFTALKGYEYTDAMDSDRSAAGAAGAMGITRRQALALFAKAAAKQTEGLDMQEIVENLGVTDSVEAIECATLFFTASRRAGRMRIAKL